MIDLALNAESPRPTRTWVVVSAWAALTAAVFAVAIDYEHSPGVSAAAPPVWPESSKLPPPDERPSLVMVVHPHCPCSRASISELAIIVARCRDRLEPHVLFLKPDGVEKGWEKTDLWEFAATIPGVTVHIDLGGQESRRFGAETSGQVFVYSAEGELEFAGGITKSRGHEGGNRGRDKVIQAVLSPHGGPAATPVFGCELGTDGTFATQVNSATPFASKHERS